MTRSVLPRFFLLPLEAHLDQMTVRLLRTPGSREVDFSKPVGEPALVGVDSVSWRIFKNPVSVFVGGTAAVILELAEPSVRSGVWEHSSFRTNPVRWLQRTGMAAMMTVYGPRNAAEKMIAGVNIEITAAFFGATVALANDNCRTAIGEPSPTNGAASVTLGARVGTLMD